MTSFGIFMRKSWHYLALGCAGVPCAKCSSSISGSLFSPDVSKSLFRGQSHHLKHPYTYCCLLQKKKKRLTFNSWKVVCQDSLEHEMNLNLVCWFVGLDSHYPWCPFRDQMPVYVLVRLKALDGETCVLFVARHGPCHIVGSLEMVVELANELITHSRQLTWFTDKSPDSGTAHLDPNPVDYMTVGRWPDFSVAWFSYLYNGCDINIHPSRLLAGLSESVCVKNREQGQAYNKGSFTEFPRLWQRGRHKPSSLLLPFPHTILEEASFVVSVLAWHPLLLIPHCSLCVWRWGGGLPDLTAQKSAEMLKNSSLQGARTG